MDTTRRDFIRYCGMSAAALGLSATDLLRLEEVLANPKGPTVLWLQGASCSGCSVSLLNRISSQKPTTAADLLINSINLAYHPTLMAAADDSAVSALDRASAGRSYILVLEGGVPTAFGGATCFVYGAGGQDVTFAQAVQTLAARASRIVSVGTCASWGGIPAAGPNVTTIRGVAAYTGKRTINIAGCPPHPDWIVWAIAQLMLKKRIGVDAYGRPTAIFGRTVHDVCPLRETEEASSLGQAGRCLEELGCRGPHTQAPCPNQLWNGGVSWCIGAGALCIGCTQSTFPGATAFYRAGEHDD